MTARRLSPVFVVYGLGALGLAATALVTAVRPPALTPALFLPLTIFAGAAFFSGIYQIRISSHNVVSLCVAAFAGCVLAFGPVIGAWVAGGVDLFITLADNRRIKKGLAAPPPAGVTPAMRAVYNTGLNAAMFLAGGFAFRLAAGQWTLTAATPRALLGVGAFFVALHLVNGLFTATYLSARGRRPFGELGREIRNSLLFDLPLMPAAVVLALLYAADMTWGLAFAGASLVLASTLLQRENRLDLVVKRYVSPAKSSKILANPYELLRPERRDISIVFSDLRGTTGVSQTLEPAAMLEMLNEFHRGMIEEVVKAGATVDKILGDGLMVLVGAPVREEDHAARAVQLAVAMQRRYRDVTARLVARGLPAPGMGVGIATGEVVIGNVGSEMRLDYTAIGSEVNVASKLCAAAAPGEILVSAACRRRVEEIAAAGRAHYLDKVSFEDRPPFTVAGLAQPLEPARVIYA